MEKGKMIINGVEVGGSFGSATSVPYSNTNSGLEATNVQGAIDELNSKLDEVFQLGSNRKNEVITALKNAGTSLTSDSTWDEIFTTLAKLFPGTFTATFNCAGNYGESNYTKTVYWTRTFDTAKRLKSIKLTLKYKHSETINSNMIKFYLEGSNNNSSWTQLKYIEGDGEDGTTLTVVNGVTYEIESSAYKYYRIAIGVRRSCTISTCTGTITFYN